MAISLSVKSFLQCENHLMRKIAYKEKGVPQRMLFNMSVCISKLIYREKLRKETPRVALFASILQANMSIQAELHFEQRISVKHFSTHY